MLHSTRGVALGALALTAAATIWPGSPAFADATVNGSRRTEVLNCNGADALVNGDNNRLMFQGDCRSLHVNGAGNVVQIQITPGGTLGVVGDGNHILYAPTDPAPMVNTQGNANQVAAATPGDENVTVGSTLPDAPPAPPPSMTLMPGATPPTSLANNAPTLLLDGENQDRDVNCAGQNVLIRGSDGRFVLRGGCRSLTVQGRADAIQAELRPAARVQIEGDAVTMNYTLTRQGPPPRVTVTGANSQATETVNTPGPVVVTQPDGSTTVIGNNQ